MGEQAVNKFNDPKEKRVFTKNLLRDIQALERMLEEKMFETGIQRIGAEQELVLVDDHWKPATNNLQLLEEIDDEHYTTEIARFNLEINLDPFEFTDDCFEKVESQLREQIRKGQKVAAKYDTKIMLTGILPTLSKEFLHFKYMTPNPRYEALNDSLRGQKGGDFELNIVGLDELMTKHENILFEACNTSFQIHLQIEPDEFTEMYNWAQCISGPVLSVCTNSPLLLGKRLWSETRIALFQQSVDTRNAGRLERDKEPRVTFGHQWLRGTVADLFKDNISRYNLLFAGDDDEDSIDVLDKGGIPKLAALILHNGTVYKWNRPCYGVGGGKPHLRIENRYIPSGPTVVDEMANTAFWLGIMVAMPEEYKNLPDLMNFEDCRFNFYNASRRGMASQMNWFGKKIAATELVRDELLPLAQKGLESRGINPDSIKRLLGVIKGRIEKDQNGATWQRRNFTELLKGSTPNEASINITKKLYQRQEAGRSVSRWKDVNPYDINKHKEFKRVNEIMETDLFTVREDDLLDLVVNVMNWQNIRHVPVENAHNELVGMINTKCILSYLTRRCDEDSLSAKDIMIESFPTVGAQTSTKEAIGIMADTRVDALPVVSKENKLVGIITESDIIQVANMTKKFRD